MIFEPDLNGEIFRFLFSAQMILRLFHRLWIIFLAFIFSVSGVRYDFYLFSLFFASYIFPLFGNGLSVIALDNQNVSSIMVKNHETYGLM